MLKRLKIIIWGFLLCSLLLVGPVDAIGAAITKCQTITTPGLHVLVNNLVTQGTCIVIASDFVTLELAGFTIRGNGTGMAITDGNTGRKGITVRNGVVTNFDFGVDLALSNSIVVEGVKAIGNSNAGFDVGTFCILINNIAEGNGTGIHGDAFCNIINNISASNQDSDIACGPDCTIVNNTVFSNPGVISITNGFTGGVVRSNTVSGGCIMASGTVIDNAGPLC